MKFFRRWAVGAVIVVALGVVGGLVIRGGSGSQPGAGCAGPLTSRAAATGAGTKSSAAEIRPPVGSKAPPRSISLSPSDDMRSQVAHAGKGASFALEPGSYRITSPIEPKTGQRFFGEGKAVLTGAKPIVTSWRRDPRTRCWEARVQLPRSQPAGRCTSGDACTYNDDLFFDGARLRRVTSTDELGSGRFFIDYDRQRILIGADPRGHDVEVAAVPEAFTGTASHVTINGFTIQGFATPAGRDGAISAEMGSGWTVSDNLIRLNHSRGVSLGPRISLLRNKIVDNGMLGAGGGPRGGLIRGNLIAYNNALRFECGVACGGIKSGGDGSHARYEANVVRANFGPGLWCDVDCRNVTYTSNRIVDNMGAGIQYEISCDGLIADNLVRGNGMHDPRVPYGRGAGIQIVSSSRVAVRGNKVAFNGNGVTLLGNRSACGHVGVDDVVVTGNQVSMGKSGRGQGVEQTGAWRAGNANPSNRFHGNSYCLAVGSGTRHFHWGNSMTSEGWRSAGNDVGSAFKQGGCGRPPS